MADFNQKQGLSGLGALALGAVAYGAWQWRKSQQAKGTYDGNGDGKPDNAPTQPGPVGS